MEPPGEEEFPGTVGTQRWGRGTILLLRGTASPKPAPRNGRTGSTLLPVKSREPPPLSLQRPDPLPSDGWRLSPRMPEPRGEGTLLPHGTCRCPARFCQVYPSPAVQHGNAPVCCFPDLPGLLPLKKLPHN